MGRGQQQLVEPHHSSVEQLISTDIFLVTVEMVCISQVDSIKGKYYALVNYLREMLPIVRGARYSYSQALMELNTFEVEIGLITESMQNDFRNGGYSSDGRVAICEEYKNKLLEHQAREGIRFGFRGKSYGIEKMWYCYEPPTH